MGSKKYYWLRLQRDFFKRHDIKIIESMPNGKDYILFYLKLLVESIDHNGELRFSETIPYNEQMLSTITNTNVDIVKAALDVFVGLGMVEIFDDSTIYMTEVDKMIGSCVSDEQYKENHRLRQQRYRERQKALCDARVTSRDASVTQKRDVEIDIDKEIDIEIDKDIEIKKKKKEIVRHKYGEYSNVLLSDEELEKLQNEFPSDWQERIENLSSYMRSKGKSYKDHLATIRNWARKETKPRQTSAYMDAIQNRVNVVDGWV